MRGGAQWVLHNPAGKYRVVVTKPLVGDAWLNLLVQADCRVDQCLDESHILSATELRQAIGQRCDAVMGELTEKWDADMMECLKAAGGRVYTNVAVGYDNVDVAAATRLGIAVGNTPGVPSEATAEMGMALALAAGRRVVEADAFMRAGKYHGWLPDLFLGNSFYGGTLGLIGAGRIGTALALRMARGCYMDVVYYDLYTNERLEQWLRETGELYARQGERRLQVRRAETLEELLRTADVISLNTVLDASTHHIIDTERLRMMKEDAVLVNCGRGGLIDEVALAQHCRQHPRFRAALDVFEHEPEMVPDLKKLPNVVVVPHIGSATVWARAAMCILAATNVTAILRGDPIWGRRDMGAFIQGDTAHSIPRAAPSIVNASQLHLSVYDK
ncbi:hypothetical protein CDCA_CDCA06G1803 [Cyanidium caldarium]|uniref:Glycerate dehydrogenase n=1 Tax=Cyanidium caldarium TaxID=2771 RepID=A0AAV9IUL3_CYACA|nr:hypothetical protein CDCA_CDCA06G1803 [Cyanidium caldarium]